MLKYKPILLPFNEAQVGRISHSAGPGMSIFHFMGVIKVVFERFSN